MFNPNTQRMMFIACVVTSAHAQAGISTMSGSEVSPSKPAVFKILKYESPEVGLTFSGENGPSLLSRLVDNVSLPEPVMVATWGSWSKGWYAHGRKKTSHEQWSKRCKDHHSWRSHGPDKGRNPSPDDPHDGDCKGDDDHAGGDNGHGHGRDDDHGHGHGGGKGGYAGKDKDKGKRPFDDRPTWKSRGYWDKGWDKGSYGHHGEWDKGGFGHGNKKRDSWGDDWNKGGEYSDKGKGGKEHKLDRHGSEWNEKGFGYKTKDERLGGHKGRFESRLRDRYGEVEPERRDLTIRSYWS